MDILDDYCLIHIFNILNIKDWIVIQQVCTRWEKLTRPFWGSINKIVEIPFGDMPKKIIKLNPEELYTIAKCAGPFIKTINISSRKFIESTFCFGKFPIAVKDICNEPLLGMMCPMLGSVTNLNLRFGDFNEELVFELILTNKYLKILSLGTCSLKLFSVADITFDSVEDVALTINDSEGVENFHWPFPNAETLRLTINYMPDKEINQILERILPFVKQLKFLALNLKIFESAETVLIPALSFVSKFNDLESIMIAVTSDQLCDSFITDMAKKCQMLKNIELHTNITKDSIEALMSLPHLESLILDKITSFSKVNLDHRNLNKFNVRILSELKPEDFEHLRKAICGNMPRLEHLSVSNLSTEQCLILTFDAINLATEQNKEAIVYRNRYSQLLKIVPEGYSPEDDVQLQIIISEQTSAYEHDIKLYVKHNHPYSTVKPVETSKDPYIRVSLPRYQIRFDESHFNS